MLVSKLKKITPTPIKILKRKTFNYFENNFISTYGSKDKDLFIGPWLGDVGKELMYWIPYVRKMNKDGKLLYEYIAMLADDLNKNDNIVCIVEGIKIVDGWIL